MLEEEQKWLAIHQLSKSLFKWGNLTRKYGSITTLRDFYHNVQVDQTLGKKENIFLGGWVMKTNLKTADLRLS